MSEFLYKQKYLKYKNKYNELKNKFTSADRLETENISNSIFLLSDTPTFNMNGGEETVNKNEETYNLSDTPTYGNMEGGNIDATPGNFTPNVVSGSCAGVVNPVPISTTPVTALKQKGGDIDMSSGNFTPNVVSGSCPGVVNPVLPVPISTTPVTALKQKGGDINMTPGNFPMTDVNANTNVNPTGANLYTPLIQNAGPAGNVAAMANPLLDVTTAPAPMITSNKNLSINEQLYETTTDMSEGHKESESLSDIRTTADIDRLFKQLGGKNINKEYYSSSSDDSTTSSSIFSSSDSDTDLDHLKKY